MVKYYRLITIFSWVALALTTSACGRKSKLEIPSEVMPYVKRFEAQSSRQGQPVQVTDLVIQFKTLPNANENGVCEISGDETPQIYLSTTSWASMDDNEREALVFHECGHCVIRRKHRDDYSGGIPASVMNTYALDSWTYSGHYSSYQVELFSRRNEF